MRMLIIEDDSDLREHLSDHFTRETFAVDQAKDGEEGSYMARVNEYDIIILDFILPKKDGLKVLQEIRKSGKNIPIIVLSVVDEIPRKVNLLDEGADDYLSKPFSLEELKSRINAILRRPGEIENAVIEVDDIVLDTSKHIVTRAGKVLYLTRKEFGLLEYLMRNRGKMVSRGMIMEHVWNAESDPFSNTVEAHILNLRKKINDNKGKKRMIHNIPGRGYKFDIRR